MKIELNIYEDVDEENSDIVLGFCRNDNRKFFASGTWYKQIGFETRFDFENIPNRKRIKKCSEIGWWGSFVLLTDELTNFHEN